MSKELPYFKFYPNEWVTGDITLLSMEVQGVFMNVCAIYWSKNCRVAIAGLSQRYGEAIATLLKSGIIKEKRGFAVINFLDEQYNEFDHSHKINSENGKKGNEIRWGKSRGDRHPVALREEKRKEDEMREENKREDLVFPFLSNEFLSIWKVLIKEKKWRKKSFSSLQASLLLLGKYDENTAIQMMKNTIAGEWQGLFEIKNIQNNGNKQPISNQGILEQLKKNIVVPDYPISTGGETR